VRKVAKTKVKVIKTVIKPNYIVEDLRNPPESQVRAYRRKRVGDNLLTIAFLKGGGSRVTSIWKPKDGFEEAKQRAMKRLRR